MPSFRGKLQQMDNKAITIALDDDRQVDFKRNEKTKFFKNGEELKNPKFGLGDQLSVEGPQDEKGYLIAVNVYWEKAAGAQTAATKGGDTGAVDTWKDNPKEAAPASGEAVAPVTHVDPPPVKPDSDDPGPPVLHRGKPADVAREHAPEPPAEPAAQTGTAGNAPPVSAPRTETAEAAAEPRFRLIGMPTKGPFRRRVRSRATTWSAGPPGRHSILPRACPITSARSRSPVTPATHGRRIGGPSTWFRPP